MDTQTHSQLRRLAELHGLQLSYTDISGATQVAREGPLRACLAALGAEVGDDDASLAAALARAQDERWSQLLPPVVVAWDGVGSVSIRVPAACAGRYALEAVSDGGAVRSEGRIEDLPVASSEERGGKAFVERTVQLPGPLAPGYYELHLRAPGLLPPASLLVAAPRRVFEPAGDHRGWGMFVPLYALKTQRDHGVGDFTDLQRLTEWVGDRGGSMVGTLPLLATFLDDPYEPSPYSPASRLAWNELHLDVEALPEYALSPVAQRAFTDADAKSARAQLRAAPFVDHKAAMALKRRALEPMAEVCWSNGGPRRAALEAFLAARPEIDAYAKFRAVGATRRESWHVWPANIQRGNIPERSFDPRHYRYHAYVQWAVHQQLEQLSRVARDQGSGLYLDLPVGVHGDGFDPWLYPDAFVSGLSTGAPPDALFAGGQNWAFPPPSPKRQRENHYRYLIAVLQNHLRYAGVLRIDHVMGLHRLFVIPAHAPASDGMYLRFPAPELYALLSLESHRSQTVLIGENLGTVPDEVQHAMHDHGVHGMHVVQYQARRDPNAALPDAAPGDVASLNTHDMPPFAAYWTGADLDVQQELGFIDAPTQSHLAAERADQRACLTSFLAQRSTLTPGAEAADALPVLMRHLGQSEARLVLVNLEDLWGETHAQNVPGTWREHANWQHRTRFDFETWCTDEEVLAPLKELQAARAEASYRGEVRYDVSQLGDEDLHYWNEGTHARVDGQLGAHPMTVDGLRGTSFAVWAPGATYVSVIGDFNHWDRGKTPLKPRGSSGIWEGFVIGVGPGELYKLHVASEHESSDRADPFAFATEEPPRTASKIADLDYAWGDERWMEARAERNAHGAPMSIYEVHLGSWRRVPEEGDRMLTYRELAVDLVQYVREMGFTHVELLPVMEHPFYGSWGYQTTGYFAPSARQGSPTDFKALVDAFHAAGIGVLLDWVPSHFPTDAFALARFDGTHLYEHADPKQGFHPDWNTAIFNYDRHEVRAYLQSSARFWCEAYHADGLRVDAVASMLYLDYSRQAGEWVPNVHGGRENLGAIEALRQINETVYAACPGVVTIAEESTSWPLVSHPTDAGGLGFGFKWDMGWMHDTLDYFARDPIHRKHHQNDLTFRMMYAFGENYVLPLSHDEVVHGKGSILARMPGDDWQKFANLRALYGYMYGQPGKKLLFMGCEFGQAREWNHDASLDWHLLQPHEAHGRHEGVRRWVADLNRLHQQVPALHERDCDPGGFTWIDIQDAEASVFTFVRWDDRGTPVLVVCNLTPVVRENYGVGVPHGGWWHELANSDAAEYGGSGVGNEGGRHATDEGLHGQPHRLTLRLPPLSVSFFSPEDPRR